MIKASFGKLDRESTSTEGAKYRLSVHKNNGIAILLPKWEYLAISGLRV